MSLTDRSEISEGYMPQPLKAPFMGRSLLNFLKDQKNRFFDHTWRGASSNTAGLGGLTNDVNALLGNK